MDRSNDPKQLDKIRVSIKNGDFKKASSELEKFVDPSSDEDELLTMAMYRYSSLNKQKNLGVIGFIDYFQKEAEIVRSLYEVLIRVEDMLNLKMPESKYSFTQDKIDESVIFLTENQKSVIFELNKLDCSVRQDIIDEFQLLHSDVIQAVKDNHILRMLNLVNKIHSLLQKYEIDVSLYCFPLISLLYLSNGKVEYKIDVEKLIEINEKMSHSKYVCLDRNTNYDFIKFIEKFGIDKYDYDSDPSFLNDKEVRSYITLSGIIFEEIEKEIFSPDTTKYVLKLERGIVIKSSEKRIVTRRIQVICPDDHLGVLKNLTNNKGSIMGILKDEGNNSKYLTRFVFFMNDFTALQSRGMQIA